MNIERPDFIPEEIWRFLPALPLEYPGIYGVLPLPRFLLEEWYTPPGAEFRVNNLIISPTEVNPGQPVSISCTVTNIGSEAGTETITLGGDFMAEKTVSLEPGASTTVSFEVTPSVAKTYSVSVDGLSGSFRATTVPVADIRVENLVISPVEVTVGSPVSISVTATNYGTVAGTKRIVCNVT